MKFSDPVEKLLQIGQANAEQSIIDELEEVRRQGACDVANVTAADLIDAIGNDTQLVFAAGKALLGVEGYGKEHLGTNLGKKLNGVLLTPQKV